ncbi:ABC transporter ATP-binding protein [Coralliovum pocilloporae]|uniref:ABC transporter ATP-binding protein n=1 Tax=Coralliovum pocilloporae TaxID=3066369 RepID=UPI00330724F1
MTEPVLELVHVCKAFGALAVTDDVSLDVKPGEIHALIGPNGAGKSTLVGQIAGWLEPDAGSVRLMGQDLSGLSVSKRALLGLGRSFQVSSLALDWTARRNVMLSIQARQRKTFRFWRNQAQDGALRAEATDILTQVGLAERMDVPASELSHGERRQLELACALALKPKILLLDEPMAGLGAEGSQRMTQFLASLKATCPILLIEHDMDAVFALADRISVLVYGRIICTGTVDEIRAHPDVREAYLGEDHDA